MKAPKKLALREPKVSVTDTNIGKAAIRLLGQRLVSTELLYVHRVLGSKATQQNLDSQVQAVRKLPWASIAIAD